METKGDYEGAQVHEEDGGVLLQPNSLLHTNVGTEKTPYKYQEYGKSFTAKSSLNDHKRSHYGEKPFKCEQCNKSFTAKSSLAYHIRSHNGEKPFKCEHCNKSFTRKNSLKEHMSLHNGNKPFNCVKCGTFFKWRSGLTQHRKTHDEDNTVSRTKNQGKCNYSYFVDCGTNKQEIKEEDLESVDYLQCVGTVKEEAEEEDDEHQIVTIDQRIMEEIGAKDDIFPYVQYGATIVQEVKEECERGSVDPLSETVESQGESGKHLAGDESSEEQVTDFSIQETDAVEHLVEAELSDEQLLEVEPSGEQLLKAESSDENIEVPESLDSYQNPHMRSNNGESLEKHIESHRVENPFSCEMCDKSFSRSTDLATHLTQHMVSFAGEKPFECERCGKSFTTKSNLIKHLVLHSVDVVYNVSRGTDFANNGETVKQEIEEKVEVVDSDPIGITDERQAEDESPQAEDIKMQETELLEMSKCVDQKDEEKEKAVIDWKLDLSFDNLANSPTKDEFAASFPRLETNCDWMQEKETSTQQFNFKAKKVKKKRKGKIKVKKGGSGHECETCGYRTTNNQNMNKHKLKHSQRAEPMPFTCNECGDTFLRMDSLRRHIKSIHEGLRLKCEYCDFTCIPRTNKMNEHIKREHLGTLFEVCIECGAKVKTKRDLLTHKATMHGKGKMFPCSKCDFKAATNQRLQEHDRQVHEKIFFKCMLCTAEFVRKYNLKRHLEGVHKTALNQT